MLNLARKSIVSLEAEGACNICRGESMRNFLNKSTALHLPERIKQLAKNYPTKIAIRNEAGDEISYGQFYKAAGAVAEGLKRTGDAGKSVAVMCKDPLQMAIGLFGAWYNYCTAIPLHYSYPTEEIVHRLKTSGAEVILTDSKYPAIQNNKNLNIKSLLNSNSVESNDYFDEDASALVLFTSGTTGKPKGVVHSFSTLSHQISDLHSAWEISSNDEFFLSLPLNHIHGLMTGMLNGLAAGASVTMHGQFEAEQALRKLKDERTTFFTAVPAIYSKLLVYARANNKSFNLDHLRLMISGSSPLSEPLLNAWMSEFRKKGIVERYGMTETGMIASNDIKVAKAGCVGKALNNVEIKIDSNIDGFGQILVRGPGLFKGYLFDGFKPRDPLEFFNTGDQGYFDGDGDLKLVGRDRDILKVSGYKVGCGEIESEIGNCPGVQECAVIGLVDPRDPSNQLIACLLVSDSDDIVGEVRRILATRLAHYKIPRKWQVTKDPLPRNLIGKPDHTRIIELFK